jgi:hypothetical protein
MLSPNSRMLAAFAVLFCTWSGVAAAATSLVADGTMQVPGHPLAKFDGSATDPAGGLYALADRSNASVDFFDIRAKRFVWRATGFAGQASGGSSTAGPNGVAFVGRHQLWAGDGNSSVKIVDLDTHRVVDSIDTGGKKRVDELAYDPHDDVVIAANNADKPAFLSVISAKPPYRVVAHISVPQATNGLEQPVWDPQTHLFYVAVPVLHGNPALGGIAVIDPHTRRILRIETVRDCEPAGLALGPHQHLLAGCSDDAIAQGFPAKSVVLDARTGQVLATFRQVGGSDEVYYDRKDRSFDLAAVANPGGPVLGVIDAAKDKWVQNLPSGLHAHAVAADGNTGNVFVPVAAGDGNRICPSGCIRVYAPGK